MSQRRFAISSALVVLSCGLVSAADDVRLPAYSRQVLPNGIVLDVIPKREVPLIAVRIVVRGGLESDPANLAGLSAVTAEALRRGTATRSAEQFSQELDFLGASFDAGSDLGSTSITAEFLAQDFAKGLDLLLDVVLRPSFPEAEVKKLLAQRIDASRLFKDNPRFVTNEFFRSFYFGPGHPYGRTADEVSLSRISRNDMVAYHKAQYVGRNMIVIVSGDIEAAAGSATMISALKGVPSGTAYAWKQVPPVKRSGPRVAIVDKPDATETQFRIGLPGVDRSSPDRVPLWLVNTLFGGRFTSVLNDALRVNSGLTYGANSNFDQNHLPGRITISSFTATANTVKAINMALEVLKTISEKGIDAEQLASAKAYIKGTYPADRLETADQLAGIVSEIELFDLNRGEVDDLFSRIDAVTVEKANETIRRYLRPGDLTFLLLGNASQFPPGIGKYAADQVRVPISAPGLQVVQ
ncbi:MAG: insulinase family protein [Bryobacteraceae bacterium]|nr:insulinase family protein [Bryobacteraceae bacterium]